MKITTKIEKHLIWLYKRNTKWDKNLYPVDIHHAQFKITSDLRKWVLGKKIKLKYPKKIITYESGYNQALEDITKELE